MGHVSGLVISLKSERMRDARQVKRMRTGGHGTRARMLAYRISETYAGLFR